ncbi:MAG: ABC transporter permease subunit [Ruminococcaceae bacterium]|nr:ABC transporter permease subunit [Oscillospiraceae bacterium]
MKTLFAFTKKEFFEVRRTGKLLIIMLLFLIFGIMNPATAKIMPVIMDMLAESMTESGVVIKDIEVNAMTSWAQFFKNISTILIIFILLFSDVFTKEYKTGTLQLVLTKGLARHKVVIAKTLSILSFWTIGYIFSFSVTYGYNEYFWDNSIMNNLFSSVVLWWLFGVCVISLIIFFSSFLQNNIAVLLSTGGVIILMYLLNVISKLKPYIPVKLININPLLASTEEIDAYTKAIIVTIIFSIVCIASSIPILNKRQF